MFHWFVKWYTRDALGRLDVAEAEAHHWRRELINLRNSISGDADALARANARAEAAESARLKLADEAARLRQELRAIRDKAHEAVGK